MNPALILYHPDLERILMSPHRGFSADFWIASLHKLHSEEIATTWPSLALCGGTPMGCLPQSCDCTLSRLTAQGLYSGT